MIGDAVVIVSDNSTLYVLIALEVIAGIFTLALAVQLLA